MTDPNIRNRGQWIILDSRLGLQQLGRAFYPGKTPQSYLDPVARQILLWRMRDAVQTKSEIHEPHVQHSHAPWKVRIIPIFGAYSGQVLAVAGCYVPVSQEFPPRPLIATFEWRIPPAGSGRTIRAYHGSEVFPLYGLEPPRTHADARYPEGNWWDVAFILDDLVMDLSRTKIRNAFERQRTTPSEDLNVFYYQVKNRASGEIQAMRGASRLDIGAPGPDQWIRGITTKVPAEAGLPPGWQDNITPAFMAISRDALAILDSELLHVFMTNTGFEHLGLSREDRVLTTLCHEDDLPQLLDLFTQARGKAEQRLVVGPLTVRFRRAHGGYRPLGVHALGWLEPDTPHHVLCKFTDPDGRPAR